MSQNETTGPRTVQRRQVLKAAGAATALGTMPATVSAETSVTLYAYVHKTKEVNSKRIDQAHNALDKLESEIDPLYDVDLTIYSYGGHTSLQNSKSPGTNDSARYDWESYVEDTLHDEYYLGWGDLHVPLYNHTEGAGFSSWNVGGDETDDPIRHYKEYRSYEDEDGQYGFANVNVATGNWPYDKTWFKATVMHEIGHLFGALHEDGRITEQNGDHYSSPMSTWYVEQKCYTTNNDEPSSLCYDASGSKDACHHDLDMSYCARRQIGDWLVDHY